MTQTPQQQADAILAKAKDGTARATFTPGPWKVRAWSFCDDGTVAFEVEPIREVNRADASLIAAAPELYDLLRRVLSASEEEYWDKTYECLDDIKALIDRIDGDTK